MSAPCLFQKPDPAAAVRLFCFPYAGGGASMYRRWPRPIAGKIDVCPVQPPGRENRYRQSPHQSMHALVEELASQLKPFLPQPFAFFGYSLGGQVAYHLALHLRALEMPLPQRLFVGASRAPQRPSRRPPIHHLPDEEFLDAISKRYEGMASFVLQNRELLAIYLPAMKADFSVLETVGHNDPEPLHFPISAFAGQEDEATGSEDVAAWREQTTAEFKLRTLPGGHFFINQQRDAVLRAIGEDLLQE